MALPLTAVLILALFIALAKCDDAAHQASAAQHRAPTLDNETTLTAERALGKKPKESNFFVDDEASSKSKKEGKSQKGVTDSFDFTFGVDPLEGSLMTLGKDIEDLIEAGINMVQLKANNGTLKIVKTLTQELRDVVPDINVHLDDSINDYEAAIMELIAEGATSITLPASQTDENGNSKSVEDVSKLIDIISGAGASAGLVFEDTIIMEMFGAILSHLSICALADTDLEAAKRVVRLKRISGSQCDIELPGFDVMAGNILKLAQSGVNRFVLSMKDGIENIRESRKIVGAGISGLPSCKQTCNVYGCLEPYFSGHCTCDVKGAGCEQNSDCCAVKDPGSNEESLCCDDTSKCTNGQRDDRDARCFVCRGEGGNCDSNSDCCVGEVPLCCDPVSKQCAKGQSTDNQFCRACAGMKDKCNTNLDCCGDEGGVPLCCDQWARVCNAGNAVGGSDGRDENGFCWCQGEGQTCYRNSDCCNFEEYNYVDLCCNLITNTCNYGQRNNGDGGSCSCAKEGYACAQNSDCCSSDSCGGEDLCCDGSSRTCKFAQSDGEDAGYCNSNCGGNNDCGDSSDCCDVFSQTCTPGERDAVNGFCKCQALTYGCSKNSECCVITGGTCCDVFTKTCQEGTRDESGYCFCQYVDSKCMQNSDCCAPSENNGVKLCCDVVSKLCALGEHVTDSGFCSTG